MVISKTKYGVFLFINLFLFIYFFISDGKIYQFLFEEITEKHRKIDLISRFKYA